MELSWAKVELAGRLFQAEETTWAKDLREYFTNCKEAEGAGWKKQREER